MIEEKDLENLSYETKLNKSLKNTIHKFDKNELIEEIENMIGFYSEKDFESIDKNMKYRIKSLQSFLLKYDKYYPATPLKRVANDILGIRYIINSYSEIDTTSLSGNFKIIDMTKGKSNDDGYRGFHIYYEKDSFNYSIEI